VQTFQPLKEFKTSSSLCCLRRYSFLHFEEQIQFLVFSFRFLNSQFLLFFLFRRQINFLSVQSCSLLDEMEWNVFENIFREKSVTRVYFKLKILRRERNKLAISLSQLIDIVGCFIFFFSFFFFCPVAFVSQQHNKHFSGIVAST
jgi:hypothetical protein